MTSLKVKFRVSTVSGREGSLYFQVINSRVARQINTDYKILESEWNYRTGTIVPYPQDSGNERMAYVRDVIEKIRWDKMRLSKIITALEKKGEVYTADDVVEKYQNGEMEVSFFRFMQTIIDDLKGLRKVRTSETYTSALKSFSRFRDGLDVMLEDIDSNLMMRYEAWLKSEEVSMNSCSFYMRILQATYNRAVESGLTEQKFPFRHVYTGVEKTVKCAIPFNYIKKLKNFPLPAGSSLDFARDMFLFSFYTRGMSFVDIAYLKKKDLNLDILTYRRRKTGQVLYIRWERCMQEVVDKYSVKDSPYLLSIIKEGGNERGQYINALHLVNNRLKDIANMMGIPARLTMYVARHSWASVARSKNIPVSVISEGMGHDSETTTQIYLASLDNSIIDNANKMILNNL